MITTITPQTLEGQAFSLEKPSPVQLETHRSEWTIGSAVSERITSLNIESLTTEELNERIKPETPIRDPGWWVRGVNWRTGAPMGNRWGQGKPDKPHQRGKGKKSAKYLTASGVEPDAIFLTMPDKDYWLNVYADKTQTVYWTEGTKKAGAGLTLDLATICLTGVWNWGKDGKLADDVMMWAKRGGNHVICFDSDYTKNKGCRQAIIRFAHLLNEQGCNVRVAVWDTAWKGMDDYIVANGGEKFKEVVANALTVKQWEKQFQGNEGTGKQKAPPSPRQIALEIAEEYRPIWAYHNEQKTWRRFNGKFWEGVEDEVFTQMIFKAVEAKGIQWTRPTFIENTVKILKWSLLVPKWQTFDRKNWINFNNCVLEVATGQQHPHQSGFRFVSCLERDYIPLPIVAEQLSSIELLQNHCPHFYRWASTAMGDDSQKMLKLLAIVNAVIKHRFYDLQMFVHLVGKPGTGKGTFSRLLEKLVGKANSISSRVGKLGDDYEIARFINSQLVICPDEDKQIGNHAGLKSLTGGDNVSYRQIYKQAADSPFYGSIVICSNYPIFAGDTTGLERRLSLVSFQNRIPDHQRNSKIEELLEGELSGLTSIALTLNDLHVSQMIKGIGEGEIPEFKRQAWEIKCQTSSVAAFLNEHLIHDPTAETSVSFIYDRYKDYCANAGSKAHSLTSFSPNLLQCADEAGWANVTKRRATSGVFIQGLRLREPGTDDGIPCHEDTFTPSSANVGLDVGYVGLENTNVGLDVGLKPLQDEAYVGYVGLEAKQLEINVEPPNEPIVENQTYYPSQPYNPTYANPGQGFAPPSNPTLNPTQPCIDPTSETVEQPPANASEQKQPPSLKVGDHVRYIRNNVKGRKKWGELDLVVEFIPPSASEDPCDVITCRLPNGKTDGFMRHALKKVD